jgi:hypothetical protein
MTVGTPLTGANGRPALNPDYMALFDVALREMALREDGYSRGAIEELVRLHNRYVYSERLPRSGRQPRPTRSQSRRALKELRRSFL